MNMAVLNTRHLSATADLSRLDRPPSRHHLEVVPTPKAQPDPGLPRETAGITNTAAATAILFGPFRLFPAQRLLLEGNTPVRLGSRALEVLIVLLEQHGELVSKKVLMARVWPDTTVVEANLSVHVAALRRALRDGVDGNRYLVNMPGRGYRFVAPIALVEDSEPAPPTNASTRPQYTLPDYLTPLPARDDNVQAHPEPLPQRRLLAVTGSGGAGKPAVSLARGEKKIDAYEHGVLLIDLGPMADPSEVARAVAAVLGVEFRSE